MQERDVRMYGVPEGLVPLEEYWEWLQISECQAYGIRNVPDEVTSGCPDYWNQDNRYWLGRALNKAILIAEKDRWLGFPVRRKYYPTRTLKYSPSLYMGKYLQGIGVQTQGLVETVSFSLDDLGSPVDPISLTVAVTFTDPNELIIKYPETYFLQQCDAFTIRPSCVEISGGVATIEIPRCRLLKPEFFKNFTDDNLRPDYTDDANFLDTVEVHRDYLDTTIGSLLVWNRTQGQILHNCDPTLLSCCSNCQIVGVCGRVAQDACAVVVDGRNGRFQMEPATYDASASSWTRQAYAVSRRPDYAEMRVMKGKWDRYDSIEEDVFRALVILAHNNLPEDYCSCSVQVKYHQDDTRPLEPPVRFGLGPSTWGIHEAVEIFRQHDSDRNPHMGGFI